MRELRDVPVGECFALRGSAALDEVFRLQYDQLLRSAGYVSAMPLMPRTLCRRLFCL